MFGRLFSRRGDAQRMPDNSGKSGTDRLARALKKTVATASVEEEVSVVLRRQVPVRFDEEARSWLGGLPRMPVGTEWPRAKTQTPLNFVAQIDCAGLPPELWGGLGPREGWLLVFIDFEGIDNETTSARVLHVAELGPEVPPPEGLYFARRDVVDIRGLPETPAGAQRLHFRKWPIDLVPTEVDTSALTGSDLYGAPESEYIIGAMSDFNTDRPMTWRGALTALAGLVLAHNAERYEQNWRGNAGGLLDYPEPDVNDFNKIWQYRRELPEWKRDGRYPDDERLRAYMHVERRNGWTQRAFKVLDEETEASIRKLDEYRTKHAAAVAAGDAREAGSLIQSVAYFEKELADRREHRAYLRDLFAQYPSEEALVAEINRVGRAHLEWAQRTQDRLRDILRRVATRDLDSAVKPADWDAIAAEIASMKSVYWRKTHGTDLLRKVEGGVHFSLRNVLREEVLDRYVTPPDSADGIDPVVIADLEPRLRLFECEKPHKMGGLIDSYYDEPLKTGHVLLFQIASDAATGWICGDLGFVYVSISASDLEAGSFDKVRAWLEA